MLVACIELRGGRYVRRLIGVIYRARATHRNAATTRVLTVLTRLRNEGGGPEAVTLTVVSDDHR